MNTLPFTSKNDMLPSAFDDFFGPWNEFLENENWGSRAFNVPAVNITEQKDQYQISLAVPGLKKDDFNIDVIGNILTISCAQQESIEEKEKKFTRREYSYASFSRSFTLPDEVNSDNIEAKYEDGILKISLPRKEARNVSAKKIAVN